MENVDTESVFEYMGKLAGDPGCQWQMMGRGLWGVQNFERSLAIYIVLLLCPTGTPAQKAYDLLENHNKKTMGQLLKKLKEHCELSDGFEERLDNFLNERNWLTHRLNRENHTDIYNADKFNRLIARLDFIYEESKALRDIMVDLSHQSCIAEGVSEEWLEQKSKRIYEEWTSGI
jgi:hypothetical protein